MSGTFTFLFTDIEGSTRLWQADRDAMSAALAVHDETLNRIVQESGGVVFKHTGDGVCAVFSSPRAALAAAEIAQAGLELPVRMGVHVGEAEERNGDYFGPALNRCARLMDAGHGGQILVSETVQALVGDADLEDLGERQLKDLATPEHVFQLGLAEFPPLRLRSRVSRLPTSLTALVGRDELIATVVAAVEQWRLVTLVGVGGVGKTRLAIAAAEDLAEHNDLTVLVDLGSVSDGADVLPSIARALEVKTPTMDSVAMALTSRRVLLVIDNCEHVLDEAADAITEMLAASDSVCVLATSREGLAVDGEHLIAVPGLASESAEAPAVALFVDRARAADAGFALDGDSEAAVIDICRRLDGIPLAIELAAARIAVMTPLELLDRLGERFRVLTGGRRRAVDRHRTLREAVDWSYQLLDPGEQLAFSRLAVFASGFDLAGAAAVLDDKDEFDVLELLGALVDKSLLTTFSVDGRSRYRYLETIRSFADEKLDELLDRDAVEEQMNRHLANLVRSVVDDMFTSPDDLSLRLRLEIPNMRRSMDWALANDDVGAASLLISPLVEVTSCIDWNIDGWAAEVLEIPAAVSHEARSALLVLRAIDLWLNGEFGAMRGAGEEMMDAATGGANEPVPWWLLLNHTRLLALGGDGDGAAAGFDRLLTAAAELGPARSLYCSMWKVLVDLGWTNAKSMLDHQFLTDLEDATNNRSRIVKQLAAIVRSQLAQLRGEFEEMLAQARLAADLAVHGSAIWFASLDLQSWAHLELGDIPSAVAMADTDQDRAYHYGDRSAIVVPILMYALCLQALREAEPAATLRGWLPSRMTVLLVDRFVEFDSWLTETLPADRLAELAATGRDLTPLELQTLAHEVFDRHLDAT